ncbi:hypothetical protein AMYBAR_006506 [Amycolatopsis bartoniae]|uniref:hypothetical protein n=1 Tax=Amycolatopsis bartoniae TaxID=941986 RepID=UPI001E34CA4E|nr:hypothetical protein [Amycolatopsis bartoniae]
MRGLLALVAVLLLTACESAAPAGGPDPRSAVEGALGALARETAVTYELGSGQAFTVTQKGLVTGTLPLHGQEVQALRAGGDLFVRAPAAHWQEQGMAADRAAEYGARWARAVLAFDPGWTFAPATVAQALRSAVSPVDRSLRATLADGLDVFDLSGLRVTAAPPYRVVSFASALLAPVVPQTVGRTDIGVRPVVADRLADLRSRFDETLDGLGQPFVAGPVVATTVTGHTLHCTGSGACTDTVHVDNDLLGDAPRASARVVLKTAVSSPRLGEQDCGQELVTPLNGTSTLSCSVKFALPKLTGTARVAATPNVSAEPVATVDPAALKNEVAAALTP